jgi:putative ATP-binding cassette transporter
VLLGLATSYSINIWNRAIFDALERRDAGTVAQVYARMTMQRRWRAWLNNHLLDR